MIFRCSVLVLLLILPPCISGCSKEVIAPWQNKATKNTTVQDSFKIAGSGSSIPITADLAEAYRRKTGITIEIPGSIGSDGAINAIKAGDLELGMISRPLTSEERNQGLKELPFAHIGIVFAAHKTVPDPGFSDAEIIEILKGSKTTWADASKIYVIMRQANDSLNITLNDLIPDYKKTSLDALEERRWRVVYREKDMADALMNTVGSFGVTNTTEILKGNSQIKALEFNGISPSVENIRNGSYKLIFTLSFVYKDPPSTRAANFLEFVSSMEGRQIITKWGLVPAER